MRVDEGEEEDVGTLLLMAEQAWFPLGIGFKAFVVIISEQNEKAQNLHAWKISKIKTFLLLVRFKMLS